MGKAIFLGSFNPPHKGHYEVVKSVIDSGIMDDFNIENIHVIPCYQNPNKAKFNTSFIARYKMCELMFVDLIISGKVIIDDIENDIKPKYTYDLIQYFDTNNNSTIQKGFWWIITIETIKELMEQKWKNSKELLYENNFIVVGKDEKEWNNLLNQFMNYKSTIRAKFIKLNKVYNFHSTEIREKAKRGESIADETCKYIDIYYRQKNNIYK